MNRRTLLLISWLLLGAGLSAQNYVYGKNLKWLFVESEDGSGLFFSKYEVSVSDYHAYLKDLKRNDSRAFNGSNYDSTLWISKFPLAYNEPLQQHYFNHKNYEDHPIVNIWLEGAQGFCKWLTKNYQQHKKYKTAVFRLPTTEELKQLESSANFEYNSDSPSDYNEFPFNMRFKNSFVKDGVLNTASVKRFPQNKAGHCSIIGNVCEMTADGTSFGGSWYCYPSQATLPNRYTSPDPRVGFRVVMEMKEE